VLFADLLGVREVTLSDPEAGLRALETATRRSFRDFLASDSAWPSTFFSDSLVVASPIEEGEDSESAIGGLIAQAAYLQLDLSLNDWFVRGGLTLGPIFLHDGLVYGPALIDAYDIESTQALHPRIVVGPEAIASQTAALSAYGDPVASPANQLLLRDDDGRVFINYLSVVFDDPDVDYATVLAEHRDKIATRLVRHRGSRAIWEKYRWVADYHNHACQLHASGDPSLRVDRELSAPNFHAFVAEDQ
jgi:hypothetical protein